DSGNNDVQRILGALEFYPRLAAPTRRVCRRQVFHYKPFVVRLARCGERRLNIFFALGALDWREMNGSKRLETFPALGIRLIDNQRVILCQNVEDGEGHRHFLHERRTWRLSPESLLQSEKGARH